MLSRSKLKYDNQILANDIRVLNWAVNNYGDPASVITGKQEKGMLTYYRQRSRFREVMKRVTPESVKALNEESTEVATGDAEKISKGLRVGDRTGTELSLKEMANNTTLYLVESLHKIDHQTGKVITNRIGLPELVDFSEAWNALVRNLAGSATPMDIYTKMGDHNLLAEKERLKSERNSNINLEQDAQKKSDIRAEYNKRIAEIDRKLANKSSFPSFIQLADKLGPPTPTVGTLESAEFDVWTDFWQDMCKPRISLIQMTNNRFEERNEDDEIVGEPTYTYSVGRTTSDLSRIEFDWQSEFKKQNPDVNPYVMQDQNRENILNLEAVYNDFKVPKADLKGYALDETKKIEFLRAIGIYLDDKLEIRNLVNNEDIGVTFLFTAIERLYLSNAIVYNPTRVLKEGFNYSYLVKDQNGEREVSAREPSQKSRLEKLAAIQIGRAHV